MLCSWEGNRRSGVSLAKHHRLSGLSTNVREMSTPPMPHCSMAPLTFTINTMQITVISINIIIHHYHQTDRQINSTSQCSWLSPPWLKQWPQPFILGFKSMWYVVFLDSKVSVNCKVPKRHMDDMQNVMQDYVIIISEWPLLTCKIQLIQQS